MIQAITFDFWNTLFLWVSADDFRCDRFKVTLERAQHKEISESRIKRAMSHAWLEWDRVWEQEQRTFGAEHWVALALEDLDVSLAQPERETLIRAVATSGIKANPPLIDGLTKLLPRLAERYRLGLICDTGLSPGWMLRQCLESHGILHFFAYLTFSDELGVSKPHAKAFLTTLAHLDVPPHAAVHVGDTPRTDIAGAQAVGMRAIRFMGADDWGIGSTRADAEIESYSELESVLDRWNNRESGAPH